MPLFLTLSSAPLPLSPFPPIACALLNSLAALFRLPVLCFQCFADSFRKTPGGVGVALASRSDFWTLGGSRRRFPAPELPVRDTLGGAGLSALLTSNLQLLTSVVDAAAKRVNVR